MSNCEKLSHDQDVRMETPGLSLRTLSLNEPSDSRNPATPNNNDIVYLKQPINTNETHRRNSIHSTPINGFSMPNLDTLLNSSIIASRRNSMENQWSSLSDDLLVPELDIAEISPHVESSFISKKKICLSKSPARKERSPKKTLCMSSFSRRKVLTRNLDTPVKNINQILLPVLPVCE